MENINDWLRRITADKTKRWQNRPTDEKTRLELKQMSNTELVNWQATQLKDSPSWVLGKREWERRSTNLSFKRAIIIAIISLVFGLFIAVITKWFLQENQPLIQSKSSTDKT